MPQTNRVNGANLIALVLGKSLPFPLVPLAPEHGTPNHIGEACLVQLWYYTLVEPDIPKAATALHALVMWIEAQQAHGFMCIGSGMGQNEVLSSTHFPIWLRIMTGLKLLISKWPNSLSGPAGAQLGDLADWWWASWRSLCSLLLVPTGPRKGQIIGPCARYLPTLAGDAVNAGVYQLASGGKLATKGLNTKALTLTADKQDLAVVALMGLLKKGNVSLGPDFESGALPKLASPMIVERTPLGHHAYFPHGIPGAIDAAPDAWVRYADGAFSFAGDPTPFPLAGAKVVEVEAV